MPSEARAAGRPLRRLARLMSLNKLRRLARLLMSPKLRRPTDRIETAVVVQLSAAFLGAVAAAPYFGERLYQSQRADAAQLRPAVAVLAPGGSADSYWPGEAARWRAPDGQWRSGTLTTETAPGMSGAPAGARVRVWPTASGEPGDPPVGQAGVIFAAVVIAIVAACGAGIVLIICYWLCRLALDRRRLAAWESAWALTGPGWTTRR